MQRDSFELEILNPGKADVYVAYPAEGPVPWPIVTTLDQSYIRAIADVRDSDPDERRVRQLIAGCSALVVVLPYRGSEACTTIPTLVGEVRFAAELGMPIAVFLEQGVRADVQESGNGLTLQLGDSYSISVGRGQIYGPVWYEVQSGVSLEMPPLFDRFLAAVTKKKDRTRPYAFFIGRLERDFAHAREAIRVAVESEAGIPCLWSDDGLHRIDVESVRERTRMLIEHATFVIADLTLGIESPKRENPSRAHEIGMTIAYGRKLMLCSQEPRRYPYFSIGDMQMTFWSTEADLECKLRELIRSSGVVPRRVVLNHRLVEANTNIDPRIKNPCFTFDANQRYVGPNTKPLPNLRALIVALGAGTTCLALAHLATLFFGLGNGAYWVAYTAIVFAVFVWPHLTERARGVLAPAWPVAQFLVLTALALIALALAATKTR
jgi:hypothetical protein